MRPAPRAVPWSGGTGRGRWCRGPREVLARGVAEERERHRAERRRVVDEHVEAAEGANDLHGDGVDVVLEGHVSGDPVRPLVLRRDAFDLVAMPRHEGDVGAAIENVPDQGEAQSGGAAGNGDAEAGKVSGLVRLEIVAGMMSLLRCMRTTAAILQVQVNLKSSDSGGMLAECWIC